MASPMLSDGSNFHEHRKNLSCNTSVEAQRLLKGNSKANEDFSDRKAMLCRP